MKRKLILTALAAVIICVALCAFQWDKNSSLKSLTHPYINTYECTAARLGNENLLNKYEYFKVTFLDDKQLELSFKRKNGNRHAYKCAYEYDDATHEFNAELGIFGFKYKQKCKIENGKFTVSMPIMRRQLIMNFAAK